MEHQQEPDIKRDRTWVDVQKKTFTRWANNFLRDRKLFIQVLEKDLGDGIQLINLLEIISDKSLPKYDKKPKFKPQSLGNLNIALQFIAHQGIKLVGIGAEDIYDGNLKLILGLIWTLILRFQIQRGGDSGAAKAELLEWVRKQVAPYGLKPKNFTVDWTDGKLLAALTDSLKPGVIDVPNLSKDALKDTELAMDVAHKEYDIPKLIDAQDMIDVPDELSNMTYISYFRDYQNEDLRRRAKEIEEERLRKQRTADPSQCYAHGPGLERGATNNDSPFTIQSVNYFGDNLPTGGNEFIVTITGPESPQCAVSDKGDGTYACSYKPTKVGNYSVKITLRDSPIKGSTYGPVKVVGPDASKSYADGPGVELAHVKEPAVFTVHAVAHDGSNVSTGNDPFVASVTGPDGNNVPVDFRDNKDGTYTGSYTPVKPGYYTVQVQLEGAPIKNSPYKALVEDANAGNSWAEGAGLKGGKTGRHNPITIHAVGRDGKPLDHGGDPFVVGISGPDHVSPAITDNKDGTYTVDYVVTVPGDYAIDITLHGQHIKDSPFNALIKPDVDSNNCYAEGPGLLGATDNETATFTIYARDGDDKPKTEGGDPFELKFEGNAAVPYNLVDNNNGTYTVTYDPQVAGDYTIHINLEGNPIKNAPYHVHVKEGTDLKNTHFSNFTFTVQTRDKNNNPKTFGGDDFAVAVAGPAPVEVQTADNGDGTYTASYLPPLKGNYTISVKFNGQELAMSPISQNL